MSLTITHVAAQDVKVGDHVVSPDGWRGVVEKNDEHQDSSRTIAFVGDDNHVCRYPAHDQFTVETEVERITAGQVVTIWPRVGRGESRDTEPGLQPWQATVVGWTDTSILIEVEVESWTPDWKRRGAKIVREIDREMVRA